MIILRRHTLPTRTAVFALVVVAFLAGAGHAATDDWTTLDEHWYVVELGGARIGFMHTTTGVNDGQYRTEVQTHLSMRRGRTTTEVEITTNWLESRDGKPISAASMRQMSREPIEVEWVFHDDSIIEVQRQSSRESTTRHDPPAEAWLTTMAIDRYFTQQREAGAKVVEYKTLDPLTGMDLIHRRHEFVESGSYQVNGEPVPVTVWRTTSSDQEGLTSTDQINAAGVLVHQEIDSPFGRMVTRLSTQSQATREVLDEPEILVTTFVRPNRRIANVRRSTTATYRVRARDGHLLDIPSAGAQRVAQNDAADVVDVSIDTRVFQQATADEMADPAFLSSSAEVNAEDPAVRDLAIRATQRADDNPANRAEAMRAFVNRYITSKDLSSSFASASEVARQRSGDCSEHAVLLTAMLRSQEIPARVAMGLVYADSFAGQRRIFAWHMWTQALIDGRWIDLDATLRQSFHAGHILTATSSVSNGVVSGELTSVLLLMNNLDIEVIEVGYQR